MQTGFIPHSKFLGEFYVGLTAKMFGGDITKNGHNDEHLGNPDILKWNTDQVLESKVTFTSDVHKINPGQIGHYKAWEKSDFPLNLPEAVYFLWTYNGRGIASLSEDDLALKLYKDTKNLLVLSFDILVAGTEGQQPWKVTSSPNWEKYYMLTATTRNELFADAKTGLARMGLNADDYNISDKTIVNQRYRRHKLSPFSVRSIIHKTRRAMPFV